MASPASAPSPQHYLTFTTGHFISEPMWRWRRHGAISPATDDEIAHAIGRDAPLAGALRDHGWNLDVFTTVYHRHDHTRHLLLSRPVATPDEVLAHLSALFQTDEGRAIVLGDWRKLKIVTGDSPVPETTHNQVENLVHLPQFSAMDDAWRHAGNGGRSVNPQSFAVALDILARDMQAQGIDWTGHTQFVPRTQFRPTPAATSPVAPSPSFAAPAVSRPRVSAREALWHSPSRTPEPALEDIEEGHSYDVESEPEVDGSSWSL